MRLERQIEQVKADGMAMFESLLRRGKSHGLSKDRWAFKGVPKNVSLGPIDPH